MTLSSFTFYGYPPYVTAIVVGEKVRSFSDVDSTMVDHKAAERAVAVAHGRDHAAIFPETPDESGYVGDDLTVDIEGGMQADLPAIWPSCSGCTAVTLVSPAELYDVMESHNDELHSVSEIRAYGSTRDARPQPSGRRVSTS